MTNQRMINFDQPQTLRCGLTLRNGFVLAPLDLRLALFDGTVSRNDEWFHQQHTRTVGLDIVGSAYVSDCGRTCSGAISVAHDTMITGLHQLAQRIHRQGAKAILQLSHAGVRAQLDSRYRTPVGPSATKTTVALTTYEVEQTINAFGHAAERAYQAGFDGVEVQGANRFLLQQFTSSLTNHRNDAFGGSLARRLTFPVRVVQRVQQVAEMAQRHHRSFAVGYRLSPEERQAGGLRLIDTVVLAHLLEGLNVDYLSLSLHNYHQPAITGTQTLPVVQVFRQQLPHLPVMVAGGVRTQADLETLAGEAAFVAMGSPLIFEPDWPSDRRRPAGKGATCQSPEQLGLSPLFLKQLLGMKGL
ncbi:NADH flavin oxidoreductase [Levilactobacillus spicheri DSM 15429]|uniref:NADH-dependent flavin oxidoreductase n=3 Tax=Levilactobacillus spicheri TaxID=216463 RepID=A0ABQ0WQ39_9LACO|nr:NADH flavin oxidoreductase [Levilactobacillus spicheri DSM 15429]GEO66897.1 NADH-dependent flavin oxidoreductase [Levilactobacillus spicheri]